MAAKKAVSRRLKIHNGATQKLERGFVNKGLRVVSERCWFENCRQSKYLVTFLQDLHLLRHHGYTQVRNKSVFFSVSPILPLVAFLLCV